MNKFLICAIAACMALSATANEPQDGIKASDTSAHQPPRSVPYVPSQENLEARQQFADAKFGVFIHWGIYSMFGQGEWYLQNSGMTHDEYAKAARGFYPADFNAKEWVSAIKDAGAKYITITSRHHDGFSMWHTAQSPYNIVDATPFKRDILKELAEECERQGIGLNFYYSHIDWTRDDYPSGRTAKHTGKIPEKENWPQYYEFMNNQLTELLTDYGKVGAIWFDGLWDHDSDSIPFNWELEKQYDLIHSLQPSCLIANNHHCDIIEGEDVQIFERDLPGDNFAGYSTQEISTRLPLETCQTINGSWGYRAVDDRYKTPDDLVKLIVGAAGRGANLLLNVGPQPSGAIPDKSLERLREIGKWMRRNGETIYATTAGHIPPQPWGCTTRRDNKLWVHVTQPDTLETGADGLLILDIPEQKRIKSAHLFESGAPVAFKRIKTPEGYVTRLNIPMPGEPQPDIIVELTEK